MPQSERESEREYSKVCTCECMPLHHHQPMHHQLALATMPLAACACFCLFCLELEVEAAAGVEAVAWSSSSQLQASYFAFFILCISSGFSVGIQWLHIRTESLLMSNCASYHDKWQLEGADGRQREAAHWQRHSDCAGGIWRCWTFTIIDNISIIIYRLF